MTWIPRTEDLPEEGEVVPVYDAFYTGLSEGFYDGDEFQVEESHGRGTFVTHWCDEDSPGGSPSAEEVHEICQQSF